MTSLEVLKPPHIQGVHKTQLSLSPGLQRPRPDPRYPSAAHAFLHSSARFHLLNPSHLSSLLPGSSCKDHETWEWVSTIPSVEVERGPPVALHMGPHQPSHHQLSWDHSLPAGSQVGLCSVSQRQRALPPFSASQIPRPHQDSRDRVGVHSFLLRLSILDLKISDKFTPR